MNSTIPTSTTRTCSNTTNRTNSNREGPSVELTSVRICAIQYRQQPYESVNEMMSRKTRTRLLSYWIVMSWTKHIKTFMTSSTWINSWIYVCKCKIILVYVCGVTCVLRCILRIMINKRFYSLFSRWGRDTYHRFIKKHVHLKTNSDAWCQVEHSHLKPIERRCHQQTCCDTVSIHFSYDRSSVGNACWSKNLLQCWMQICEVMTRTHA